MVACAAGPPIIADDASQHQYQAHRMMFQIIKRIAVDCTSYCSRHDRRVTAGDGAARRNIMVEML